jgi:signal transduction histidine kinase
VSANERPRLRSRLALLYAAATVLLGAIPVAVAGLGAWSGRSTQGVGAVPAGGGVAAEGNAGTVLPAVALGLILVALVAAPIGWALAGRALRPLRELALAAGEATADRLPEPGELGRYEEFADLSATLAGLYARLDAAYAAQRRFVADASHELRTPLTVQKALIQVALADPELDESSSRGLLEELLSLGEQQERLVAALLALAQGQSLVITEPVDLAAIAAEAVSAREPLGLTVHTDLRPAVVARTDPTLLASLIGNLLDNAFRYNHQSGRIEIETGQRGERAVLAISNTGPVVPPDAVEEILRPFQRLAEPRMQGEGNGLGLAIVQAIVDSHGAELQVLPNPEGGLAVTVDFPGA